MDKCDKYAVIASKENSDDIRLVGGPECEDSYSKDFYDKLTGGCKIELLETEYAYLFEVD
jgi:hypothetical protein